MSPLCDMKTDSLKQEGLVSFRASEQYLIYQLWASILQQYVDISDPVAGFKSQVYKYNRVVMTAHRIEENSLHLRRAV